MRDARPPRRAAVTGLGVVCSIGTRVDAFAVSLREGRSGVESVPDRGGSGPHLGALLRGFAMAEALAACRSLPEELRRRAERSTRRSSLPVQVAAAGAFQAWESAGLHGACPPPDRLGLVVAGNNLTGRHAQELYPRFLRDPAYLPPRFALQYQDTDHVGTLSEILGIRGEGFTVGAASASGNVGIINGSRLVEWGAVDACLVVGAMADLSAMELRSLLSLGAMAGGAGCRSSRLHQDPGGSPDGDLDGGGPFDEDHEGFVYGQGTGCLVLESESSARRRGATILAEIGGYDLKLDGQSLACPSEEGEAGVMLGALQSAGVEPRQVSYVNAHGSGSPLGDGSEVAALRRALGSWYPHPWVNATKGLTGHCLAAAGVVEAIATIVQMREGFVHPNAALRHPIDAQCRFVGARAQRAEIEFALSNSFGFGGFNSSILFVNPGF